MSEVKTTFIGKVDRVEKHYLYCSAPVDLFNELHLKLKRKKLNDLQKIYLVEGQPVKIETDTGKVYFWGPDKKWH